MKAIVIEINQVSLFPIFNARYAQKGKDKNEAPELTPRINP